MGTEDGAIGTKTSNWHGPTENQPTRNDTGKDFTANSANQVLLGSQSYRSLASRLNKITHF